MDDRGFVRAVVMEGMIAVVIVAVIAAIAIPQYINYRNRPLNGQARAQAYQAYEISQVFFRNNPNARATLEDISRYGYRVPPDIIVIVTGSKRDLSITATHMKTRRTYRVDALGQLSSE